MDRVDEIYLYWVVSIATRQGLAILTTIKSRVDKNGLVIARDVIRYMDGGAYSSTRPQRRQRFLSSVHP